MLLKSLAFFILLLFYSSLNGQILVFKSSNSLDSVFFEPNQVSQNIPLFLKKQIDSLQREGYLQAEVIQADSSLNRLVFHFDLGHKVNTAILLFDKETSQILQRGGFKTKEELETPLSATAIHAIQSKLVGFWENNGYPFAKTFIELEDLDSSHVLAQLKVEKGPAILFDTFSIFGSATIQSKYLAALTGIKPGTPYKEEWVAKLDQLLRTIPFVKLLRPSAILFIDNKARPMVYLDKRNNDVVDGIIGFAPPASGLTPNQRLLLTGEFKLQRNNIWGGGQAFDINARFFNERSQELKSKIEIPFIRGSNLGLNLSFNGLKFDSLYAQLQTRVGISYALNGNDKIRFFVESQQTTLISADTNLIKATRRLPTTQSLSLRSYGSELYIDRLDYPFNPRKGFRFMSKLSIGTKQIIKDARIASLRFQNNNGESYSLYDSALLSMLQYQFQFRLEKYWGIAQHSTLKTELHGEGINAPQIYFSDLIRFGGVYSLRGFNEQSLFASSLFLINIEYRYIVGENSNIFAFWNGAYYRTMQVNTTQVHSDTPFGFGAGANLETANDFLLVIAYALGREANNPIRLQAGKFHFGLTKLF